MALITVISGNRLRAKESGDRFCLVLEYLRTFLCYLRLALLCAYKLHIHIVSVPKGFSTDARYDLLNGKYGQQKRILKMALLLYLPVFREMSLVYFWVCKSLSVCNFKWVPVVPLVLQTHSCTQSQKAHIHFH